MADFDVLGTKLTITDANYATAPGSSAWIAMFNQTRVNLSDPEADNLIVFTKVPQVDQGTYAYGTIQAKTKALIALAQDALGREVEALTGQAPPQRAIDGTFNCADAQLMLFVAQTVRQQGAGQYDLWPLGPAELAYLLTRSQLFQAMVADAIKRDGTQSAEQAAAYQYAMISFPADQAPGMTFIPAQVPASCAGTAPPTMPSITPGSMCGAGLTYDPSVGQCTGGGTPVAYAEPKKGSGWVAPVAIGVGLLGAAALIYQFSRKPGAAKARR